MSHAECAQKQLVIRGDISYLDCMFFDDDAHAIYKMKNRQCYTPCENLFSRDLPVVDFQQWFNESGQTYPRTYTGVRLMTESEQERQRVLMTTKERRSLQDEQCPLFDELKCASSNRYCQVCQGRHLCVEQYLRESVCSLPKNNVVLAIPAAMTENYCASFGNYIKAPDGLLDSMTNTIVQGEDLVGRIVSGSCTCNPDDPDALVEVPPTRIENVCRNNFYWVLRWPDQCNRHQNCEANLVIVENFAPSLPPNGPPPPLRPNEISSILGTFLGIRILTDTPTQYCDLLCARFDAQVRGSPPPRRFGWRNGNFGWLCFCQRNWGDGGEDNLEFSGGWPGPTQQIACREETSFMNMMCFSWIDRNTCHRCLFR